MFSDKCVEIWCNISNFQKHFYCVTNICLHFFSVIVKSMNVPSETRMEINYLSYFSLKQKFQVILWRPELKCICSSKKIGIWVKLDGNYGDRIIYRIILLNIYIYTDQSYYYTKSRLGSKTFNVITNNSPKSRVLK